MEFILEKVVNAYGGGEKITLVVGEGDGFVVIGLNERAGPAPVYSSRPTLAR